ncbi:MAG: amidase [Streptosporangiaceae bacterium]
MNYSDWSTQDFDDVPSGAGLCGLPALDLARLVRKRLVSPAEVVQAHLDRIAALDPVLGAFQVVRAEAALAEARALTLRSDLSRLPLAGVPVAINDNVDVAGEPTRMGSAATSGEPAPADDELVARLRAAGCVVIGKTSLPELAIWPFTESIAFGAARNPWDSSRTPGGSTGGGAAAVAAGMATLALGSDGFGSIRVPAACCGLLGIKPGPGVVPLAGGAEEHWLGLTSFGPIARTVADAALALDVLAGRTGHRNPPGLPRPLRIAFSARHPLIGIRARRPIQAALKELASLLRNAGHSLTEDSPPYPMTLGLRFNARRLAGIARDADGLDLEALEPRTQRLVIIGRKLGHRTRPAAADKFAARAARWFADYDVLITPTLNRGPVPVGTWDYTGWITTMVGSARWICTPQWNLAGLPALSVPFGQDGDGLPIGMQLIGPAGSERVLLELATQIESLRPWPPLAPLPGSPPADPPAEAG